MLDKESKKNVHILEDLELIYLDRMLDAIATYDESKAEKYSKICNHLAKATILIEEIERGQ